MKSDISNMGAPISTTNVDGEGNDTISVLDSVPMHEVRCIVFVHMSLFFTC